MAKQGLSSISTGTCRRSLSRPWKDNRTVFVPQSNGRPAGATIWIGAGGFSSFSLRKELDKLVPELASIARLRSTILVEE